MHLYQPYHLDSYLREIDAIVAAAWDGWVALDWIVFYARGGGQPGEHGIRRRGDASY